MRWQKLLLSILISMLMAFSAWVVVQLNQLSGLFLFALAFFLPVLAFRNYYLKRPKELTLFASITLIALVLMTPPKGAGLNLASSLHLQTGCWSADESPWPLNGSADVVQSCSYLMEPAGKIVHVAGMAWENTEVELPITGDFVVLRNPRDKADKTYLNALQEVKSRGYVEVSGNLSAGGGILRNVLMRKGNDCVYLEELRIAKGLAVISVRGDCKAVESFTRRNAG